MTPIDIELSCLVALEGFVLDVDWRGRARVLALFGPSGSGKTTCLETIAGLRTPDRGRIAIGSHVLFDRQQGLDRPARQRGIGYVPQDGLLFPHMSVRENVLYGASRRDASATPDLERTLRLVDAEALLDRDVHGLSGGERQRVALARALMSAPQLLLLDEPLAAVDLPRRRRIVDALARVRDELGVPAIYVTHDPAEARRIADAVIILDEGRIVSSGPVAVLDGLG
jgi:molybdate transport system ATP-binding protein